MLGLHKRTLFVLGVAVMGLLIAGSSAQAGVGFSQWQSRYTTSSGTVNACVSLQGDSGCYTLNDGSMGNLSSISYTRISNKGTILIRGRWSFGGDTGNFEWRVVPDGSQFLGKWKSDSGDFGAWNASRSDDGSGNSGGPIRMRRP
jgi:hypothetical protein